MFTNLYAFYFPAAVFGFECNYRKAVSLVICSYHLIKKFIIKLIINFCFLYEQIEENVIFDNVIITVFYM